MIWARYAAKNCPLTAWRGCGRVMSVDCMVEFVSAMSAPPEDNRIPLCCSEGAFLFWLINMTILITDIGRLRVLEWLLDCHFDDDLRWDDAVSWTRYHMPHHDDSWMVYKGDNWQTAKEIFTMAKRNTKANNTRPEWRGFVNINLSDDELAEFDEWNEKHAGDFTDLLAAMVREDYAISIKYDERSDCFMSVLTCNDNQNKNAGLCITSRSPDWTETMYMAVYKHLVYCEGDWEQYYHPPRGRAARG